MAPAQAPPGLAAAREAFARAWAGRPAPRTERNYLFVGQPVQFRVAGLALADNLCRTFAHLALAIPPAVPRLTVTLWDVAETGLALPEPPLPGDAERTWESGGGYFSSYAGGRWVRFWLPYGVTWYDRAEGIMVGWRDDGRSLPIEERSRPLPLMLPVWYADQGVQMVHSGLVARSGRGVLIGGQGGSGKSTTSLACALAGFDYLGDDHIGLQETEAGWVGHSLFSGARVDPFHLAQFPALQPAAIPSDNPRENKSLVPLAEVLPGQAASRCAVSAIALPRIAGQTALRPATRPDAVRRIAPSSLTIMPLAAGAAGLRRVRRLVESVPAFWLDLGPDIREIPGAVEALLAQAEPA